MLNLMLAQRKIEGRGVIAQWQAILLFFMQNRYLIYYIISDILYKI